MATLAQQLDEIARDWGVADRHEFLVDAPRILEQATWIEGATSVLDVGGNHGLFPALLAARGARVVVVDSFEGLDQAQLNEAIEHYAALGVETIVSDAVTDPLQFEAGTFEAVTSFDAMEHFHHSPRRLFDEVRRVSKPGALVALGVPNAVNARKRVAVLFGRSNWSHFEDWWSPDVFQGHVREPTVSELRRIGDYLELSNPRVLGRNWLGYRGGPGKRAATRLVDRALRVRPSLCANIYLLGRLPDKRWS